MLLTYPRYESEDVVDLSLRIGLGILPFVLVTSIVLLAAIIVLARQQALEEAGYLASLRENYYENLRAQDQQLRQLRHDLRNHITAASGLLELGKVDEARAYLDDLGESRALGRPRRFCDNELANVVLAAKAEALEQSAIACDFSVELPADLAIADTDLCALLGNALDNAREAATGVAGAIVRLRCRADKGLFMLAVDNPIHGESTPIFPPRNQTSAPTATGCRACGASASATAERWKRASTATASISSSAFRQQILASNKKLPAKPTIM